MCACDVIDRDERHVQGHASIFAALTPTSSAPTSPGVLMHGDAPMSRMRRCRLGEGFVDRRQQVAAVGARRDLGHDAAEAGVQVGLRRDDVGRGRAARR